MDPAAREKWFASAAETLPAKAFRRAGYRKGYLFVMDNPFVPGSLLDIRRRRAD